VVQNSSDRELKSVFFRSR